MLGFRWLLQKLATLLKFLIILLDCFLNSSSFVNESGDEIFKRSSKVELSLNKGFFVFYYKRSVKFSLNEMPNCAFCLYSQLTPMSGTV